MQHPPTAGALAFGLRPIIAPHPETTLGVRLEGPLKVTPAGARPLASSLSIDLESTLAPNPPTIPHLPSPTTPTEPPAVPPVVPVVSPSPDTAVESPILTHPEAPPVLTNPPTVSPVVPVVSPAQDTANRIASSPPVSPSPPVPAVVEPPATIAPTTEARLQALLLEAFGKALENCQDRRGRDVLHIVLTAQEEQHASLVQVLADQRQEYGDQLERAVVRMSELMPESLVQAGEVFHQSAGKLTGALSRIERLSGNQIEKHNQSLQLLGDIRADLSQFLAVAAEVRDLLAHSLTGRPKPRLERRLAVIPASPDDPDDDSDILAKIRDDLDEPEDIHGPH